MKNKLIKGKGAVNRVEDQTQVELISPAENVAVRDSWLKSALGEDQGSLECLLRNQLAECFLLTVLYPLYKEQLELNEDLLAFVFIKFKQEYRTMAGIDFEMSNVLGRLLERFECYTVENLDPQLEQSYSLKRDLELFVALGEVDLKEVDKRVRNGSL